MRAAARRSFRYFPRPWRWQPGVANGTARRSQPPPAPRLASPPQPPRLPPCRSTAPRRPASVAFSQLLPPQLELRPAPASLPRSASPAPLSAPLSVHLSGRRVARRSAAAMSPRPRTRPFGSAQEMLDRVCHRIAPASLPPR